MYKGKGKKKANINDDPKKDNLSSLLKEADGD